MKWLCLQTSLKLIMKGYISHCWYIIKKRTYMYISKLPTLSQYHNQFMFSNLGFCCPIKEYSSLAVINSEPLGIEYNNEYSIYQPAHPVHAL